MSKSLGAQHPTLHLEAAFDDDPLDTPTAWYDLSGGDLDITAGVDTFEVKRGRQNELARDDAGTLVAALENDERELDPLNTASALYPNVDVMRRMRLQLEYDTVTYPIFHGFIQSPDPQPRFNETVQFVQFTCADVFASLNLYGSEQVPADYPAELSGARVNRILDDFNWPSGASYRRIDTGVHLMKAEPAVPDGKGYLQEVADSEHGRCLVAGDGAVVFHDRRHRLDNHDTSEVTFNDHSAAGYQYSETGLVFDTGNLYTDFVVRYGDADGYERLTAAPLTRYLQRTREITTRLARPGEAATVASVNLFRYKTPRRRFARIVLQPEGDEWATLLPMLNELDNRVTVHRVFPNGDGLDIESHLEGFTLRGGGKQPLTLTLDLSPVDPEVTEWVVGTSAWGDDTYPGI